MTQAIRNSFEDNSTKDNVDTTINGAEVDANPLVLADILDGTTSTALGQNGGVTRMYLNELGADDAAGAGAVKLSEFRWDPASGTLADNDGFYVSLMGDNDAGEETEYARIGVEFRDVSDGTEDGALYWGVMTGGSYARELELLGSAFYPATSDGLQLGRSSNQWSDLFLASGAVVDFNNGDVTITHSSNDLAVAGGTLSVASLVPTAIASTGSMVTWTNSVAGNYALTLNNSNATTPYVLYLRTTGAATDNNTTRFITMQDSSAERCVIYSDGDIQNHDNSYGQLSDATIKTDIADARDYWDDWLALNFKTAKFLDDVELYGDDAKKQFVLIAQEVEQIWPALVPTNSDGKKGIKYSVVNLIGGKVLQETQTRVVNIETSVADIESRLAALEA